MKMATCKLLRSTKIALTIFAFCLCTQVQSAEEPYPASSTVSGLSFKWSTHHRRASGSDNWPVTWADDNRQYTSWGDGGGFGGTGSSGRVSLGVGRVVGHSVSYQGFNVWGGKNAQNRATFEGKSYGIISIDGDLSMWVSPGSDTKGYKKSTLYKSSDKGASWTAADWNFVGGKGNFINPTFCQFGKDYTAARDNYVYIYAPELKDPGALKIQKPGDIALMRVPKTRLMNRAKYEFFAGFASNNHPIWSTNIKARKPVFSDANGVGWNTSVSYNPNIGLYLLITEHSKSFRANIGVHGAPQPWGPWTTVYYGKFGKGKIEQTTFFYNFATKWNNGNDFVLIFTGIDGNDSWNSVQGTFLINDAKTSAPPAAPVGLKVR